MPLLGTSCKAFSLLRKAAPVGTPPTELFPRLSPWHSTLFRDTNSNPYYSPSLIRIGVRTIHQQLEMGPDMDSLPRTRAPVYKDVAPKLQPPPPPPQASERTAAKPLLETKVAFWTAWNNKKIPRYRMQLQLLQPEPTRQTPTRQTPEAWKEWSRVSLPGADFTFIQQALWRKLPVRARLAGWQPRGTACPLDGQQETTRHSLLHCCFLPIAFRLASQCMGPVQLDDGSMEDANEILSSMPSLSLSSPLG